MMAAAPANEPRLAMPALMLISAVFATASVVGAAWIIVVLLGPWGAAALWSGAVGAGIVVFVALAAVLVMGPWKERTVSEWMTMWLAGTVVRLLLTPLAAIVVYSAASDALAVKPLGLSVALTYLAVLLVEATVLARHMRKACDTPADRRGGDSEKTPC